MKKFQEIRKSERIKDVDPEVLKDLKDLYGSKRVKSHLKKLQRKKRRLKKGSADLDGVLGFASLIREYEPVCSRASTHVTIAKSIQRLLNN